MLVSKLTLATLTIVLAGPVSARGEDGGIHPTWKKGDGLVAYLSALVTKRVERELAEGAPWLELAKLGAFAKKPKSLPQPLGGKANEAIWMYLPVIVAQGDLALAEAVVELLRNPAANTNPKVAFQGNLTLAEIRRARAKGKKAQANAIRGVWGELARKRFFRSTAGLQTLFKAAETEKGTALPKVYASFIDHMKTYPATAQNAGEYLDLTTLGRGTWQAVSIYREVYDELRAVKERENPKKYEFVTINMESFATEASPVVIGVFDSGVAPLRYNMYQNSREIPNGLDDDGNGLVDDISGIVWDWDPARRHQHDNQDLVEKLPPDQVREYEEYIVGAYDRRQGKDTPAARKFIARLASLSTAAQQKEFQKRMGEIGEWAHGTHVAGLATAGNRWAQVASFRFSWTGEQRIYYERGPSDQELRWERESGEELVRWINHHDVRVLNASLGFTVEYQERQLAKERDVFEPEKPAYAKRGPKGELTFELDTAAIRARAEKIQAFRREIWRQLFDGCPNTLFVLSAGNSDHDMTEFDDIPNTIPTKHDNLMIVGAVDDEGEWASFTNFNRKLVQVFDLGVNVLSHSPTGRLIPMSGTSMSSPNAANTAGKLFSLFPTLGPSQMKTIVAQSTDPIPAPYYGGIVNEEKALALARRVAAAPSARLR